MNNQANSGRIKPHYLGGHCHNLLPMTPPNNNRVTQTAVSIAWCSNTVIMNNNIFERAYTGLNISDGNYVLNHTGLDEHKNRFRNLHQYGILGNVINPNNSNSKITMVNNQFSNIKNTLPTSLPNVLIFSTAVRISGFNLEAKANRFSNIAFVSIYADKKTRRFNDPPRTYDIQNNTFSYGGVIDIFAVDNPYAVFEIQGNEFLGKLNANTTAVYIANVFTQTYLHNEPVTLVNNKVVNKSRGFYLAQVFPQLIENNLIRLSDINPNQNRNFGIKVENTGSLGVGKIYRNTINMAPGNIPTYLHVGIEANSAPNLNIANNLMDGLGRGLWFSGDNRQNEIECNTVRDYEMGWVISYSTGLGSQGNGAVPQDNQWVIRPNQTPFNRLWDIYTEATNNPITLYHRQSPISYTPTNYTPGCSLLISQGVNSDCASKPGVDREELITGDRILPATLLEEIALKRESMENTYRILMASSNLTPDQILYRDSLDAISVGYYAKLADSMYAGNVDFTKQILAQTFCTCPIDESMKKVMQVYSETFAVGIDTFTAGQIDTLMEIAMTPKHLSTRAVISARIMLKTGYDITMDFDTDFTSPKILRNDVVSLAEPIYSQVYPNPAQEILWIECPVGSEIIITDPMGKTYLKTQNQEEIFLVDLQNLPAGLYFVKIINEELVNTHKVVVSK